MSLRGSPAALYQIISKCLVKSPIKAQSISLQGTIMQFVPSLFRDLYFVALVTVLNFDCHSRVLPISCSVPAQFVAQACSRDTKLLSSQQMSLLYSLPVFKCYMAINYPLAIIFTGERCYHRSQHDLYEN